MLYVLLVFYLPEVPTITCPLLLLRTFSAHAKVVVRDAKEMRNTQDTRTGFVSCKSGRFELFLLEKMPRFSTDEK